LKIEQGVEHEWMMVERGVDKLKEIKEKIGRVQIEIDQCERDFDLKAAELKYHCFPARRAASQSRATSRR
jgi:hypothetical protein